MLWTVSKLIGLCAVDSVEIDRFVCCGQCRNLDFFIYLNPLNPELNPICHLLALLGAHHILHVSRIRVKLCREVFPNVSKDIVSSSSGSSSARCVI